MADRPPYIAPSLLNPSPPSFTGTSPNCTSTPLHRGSPNSPCYIPHPVSHATFALGVTLTVISVVAVLLLPLALAIKNERHVRRQFQERDTEEWRRAVKRRLEFRRERAEERDGGLVMRGGVEMGEGVIRHAEEEVQKEGEKDAEGVQRRDFGSEDPAV